MKRERDNDRGGDKKDYGDRDGGGMTRRRRPALDIVFDYKDIESLRPFVTEGGRISAARISRLNRKQQKILTQEVKRARQLALLPISDRHRSFRELA